MPFQNKPRKGGIVPSIGLTPMIKAKSRARRETHSAISEISGTGRERRNDLLPNLRVDMMLIDALKQANRRVRKENPVQRAKVAASLSKFGICQPILVDAQSTIVHGHEVWNAARKLGLTHVPVIQISHLSASELKLLSIAMNRLGETAEWDEGHLREEIWALIDSGEDIILTGFDEPELDALLLDDEIVDEAAENEEVEAKGAATSVVGDLWVLGDHRLCNGDALKPTSYNSVLLEGEQARMVLTDEPYNVPNQGHVTSQAHHREFAMANGEMSRDEFEAFNATWMALCCTHLMEGGLLATFMDWRSVELVLKSARDLGLTLLNIVVWAKSNGGMGSVWRSQHELLPVFKKGEAAHVNNVELGKYGRWRTNVWTYPGASSLGSDAREGLIDHPTVKPRALLEDALLDVTNRGDIILEPFAGSGSTLMAAQSTGRICRAIEIDGLYCDVIIRRWQNMTGLAAILKETGETFNDVEGRRTAELSVSSCLNQGDDTLGGGRQGSNARIADGALT